MTTPGGKWRYCPNCDAEVLIISGASQFCSDCGSRLQSLPKRANKEG